MALPLRAPRAGARRAVSSAVVVALAVHTGDAGAQLHWDASAQAGAVHRWHADAPRDPAESPGFGPAAQLAAHVALLPLVRAGLYGAFDVPLSGDASRFVGATGARVKLLSPWPSGDTRLWIHAGAGIAFARSFGRHDDRALGEAGGRFLDIPLGVGAARKVWGSFALSAELAFRFGAAHAGALYDTASPTGDGLDRAALALTIGVLYDR